MSNYKSATYFSDQTPMLRLLLPLIAGIILYDCFPEHPLPLTVLLLLSGSSFILMAVLLIRSGRYPSRRLWYYCCSQLFFVLTGYLLYRLADTGTDSNMLRGNYDYTLAVTEGAAVRGRNSTKLSLRLLGNIKNTSPVPATGRALLYLPKDAATDLYQAGDALILPAKWQLIRNSANPYEFDYSRYCRRKNIRYRQYTVPAAIMVAGRNRHKGSYTQRCHEYCITCIKRYVTDATTAALLQAIITGDESDLDPDTRAAYSDTGIIHIVSVSGAHVNLIFIIMAFLLGFIRQRRWQWIQFILSGLLVWFYVLMAGAAAPAIRAALMFTIMCAGTLLQRSSNPLNQLCTAAFLMLLFRPVWLFAIGFQLSFLALLSLLLFYKPLRGLLTPSSKILKWLWEAAAVSLAAEILVAPLVIFYFHNFPLMFLVANIMACLVMGALLILGLCLVFFAALAPLATFLGTVLTYISKAFHYCIFLLQSRSPAWLKELQLDIASLLLLYLFIAALSLFFIRKQQRALWIAVAAIVLSGASALYINWQAAAQRRLIVYNNSSFQAELLEGNTFSILDGDSNSFASANARLGYRCTNYGGICNKHVLIIAGKRILLPDTAIADTARFPADIVVLKQFRPQLNPARIYKYHRPALIVLGGGINRYEAALLQRQCDSLGISVHNTRLQGAFVFPAR